MNHEDIEEVQSVENNDPEYDQRNQKLKPASECSVCHNLHFSQEHVLTSILRLYMSRKEGCSTCALVHEGVLEFFRALSGSFETGYRSYLTGISCVGILNSQHDSLRVGLLSSFQNEIFSLDYFTRDANSDSTVLRHTEEWLVRLNLEHTIKIANKWIQQCSLHENQACKVPEYPFLPTRVLDVSEADKSSEPKVKLHIAKGELGQYNCLSYCWGKSEKVLTTTTDNLSVHVDGIPWNMLPRTYQDAINLTRALNIRFLWIDALCILQGDQEDWEVESANMAEIYSNSYLTIVATSGVDPEQGLFCERWTKLTNLPELGCDKRLLIRDIDIHSDSDSLPSPFVRPQLWLGHKRFEESDNALKHIDDAPLLSRAWAFQERLLPARTLHFHAEELIWECKCGVRCECTALDNVEWETVESSVLSGWLKQSIFAGTSKILDVLAYQWLDTVSEFSVLRITHLSDRMPALHGLSEAFFASSENLLGSYYAGVWENDFARGLLFERREVANMETGSSETNLMDDHLRPPSWSWTSIIFNRFDSVTYDTVLINGFVEDMPYFKIQEVSCRPVIQSNRFGWSTDGILKLKGRVKRGILRHKDGKQIVETESVDNSLVQFPFFEDRNCMWKVGTEFLCLLVGSSLPCSRGGVIRYAVVLQESMNNSDVYERWGLLLAHSDLGNFVSGAWVQELTII